MIYSIIGAFDRKALDKDIKLKYILSLNGEYRISAIKPMLFYKTELSFEALINLLEKEFDTGDHIMIDILEKGTFKLINEDNSVFEWVWND